jgi:cell pole-organizing protein PopZ
LLQPEETEAQITDQEVEAIDDEELSASAPEIHEISPEPEQIIQKETAPMPSAAAKSETILDEVTEISTAEAFASLNQVVEEKAIVAERGDRVGDLVMEALRPMLKEWLDENLKGIVERAVTKEVKRISSGK